MKERRWVPWALVAVAVVVVVLVAGRPRAGEGDPLEPDSTSPGGARALVLLLREFEADVDVLDGPPGAGHDTALVLSDRLGDEARRDVRAWVEAGGTLVVADPSSELAGVSPDTDGDVFEGLPDRIGRGGCELPALRKVGRIDPSAGVVYDVPADGIGCFRASGGSFLVARPEGAGTVVAIGGAGALVNGTLDHDDNSVLAVSLLAPRTGTRVAFLRPSAGADVGDGGGGDTGLFGLVPRRVQLALLQLGLAFLVFAAWRARRLGRPVREDAAVELAGSELVVAVGNLLQQARRRDRAAELLRADLRRTLADRLGLPPSAPGDVVARIAAERTARDPDEVLHALTGPPPGDEAGLVALAQSVEAVRQEVLRGR